MHETNDKKYGSPPKKRKLITHKKIISAAISVADKAGVEGLSMRSIAKKLGIEAMSLYNHVKNKDEILDQIVDKIFSEIKWDQSNKSWRESMTERAISTREVLKKHPWAVTILESRKNPGPTTLAHHDAVIGCLRKAGFSLPLTAAAFSALDSYIFGFVMSEQSLPFESDEEVAILAEQMLSQFPKDAFPNLYEFTADYVFKPGYSYKKEFLNGLDLLLDSLESRFSSERK